MKILPRWIAASVCFLTLAAPQARTEQMQDLSDAVAKVVAKTAPCVVLIDVERFNEPPLKREEIPQDPFGGNISNPFYYKRPDGYCSGIVIGEDGWILTSNFNVTGGEVKSVRVTTPDGKVHEAEIKGREENWDLAVLKINAKNLVPVKPADGDLTIGQYVVVVGKAQNYNEPTATFGILSAQNRLDGKAIQVSARMNYGNTGGALVDLDGRLIGLANSIRRNNRSGLNSGVGFARPWSEIAAKLDDLKNGKVFKGTVSGLSGPFLGIGPADDPDPTITEGFQIGTVVPGSAAQEGGLQVGDIVLEADGQKIHDIIDMRKIVLSHKVGDTLKVTYKRGENTVTTEFILKERPLDH